MSAPACRCQSTATTSRSSASLEAAREEELKTQLFASRADIGATVVKHLRALPFATAKAIVEATPRAAVQPAAAASVPVTRGKGQENKSSAPDAPPASSADPLVAAMDRVMNGGSQGSPIRVEPHAVVFGVLSREKAQELTKKDTTAR